MKSELHNYNLRRRANELPPVLPSIFEMKIKTAQETLEIEKVTSKKDVRNQKALRRRLHDKERELERVERRVARRTAFEADKAAGLVESDASDYFDSDFESDEDVEEYEDFTCLFNREKFDTLDDLLDYMKTNFSFQIHDEKYCCDISGFIRYLGEKVYTGRQCLYCNRSFSSVESTLQHMNDAGHRRVGTHLEDHVDEYTPFYDYSNSYLELNLPEEVKSQLIAIANGEMKFEDIDEDEEDWETRLTRVGYERPKISGSYLVIPHRQTEITSRKLLFGGMVRDGIRRQDIKIAKPMLRIMGDEQQPDKQADARLARILADVTKRHAKSNIKLGVKGNKLYRYIARKNKIFL